MRCNLGTVMNPSKLRMSTGGKCAGSRDLHERDIGNNTQRTRGLDTIRKILFPSYFCNLSRPLFA